MIGLVRAEWLRLRKRRDLWLVLIALVALSIPAYFSGLANAGNIGIGPGEDLPPDILAQIDEQMRLQRMMYAFPLSIGTVVENGQILLLALVAYLAAAITGADFAYGTIRTSLVARADRRGLIVVRLAGVAAAGLLLIGSLVMLGTVLPVIAVLAGSDLPAVTQPHAGELLGLLGAAILASFFVVGLTTLFALLVRNAAIALVLTIAYVFVEGAVVGLLVERLGYESPFRWLPPVADLQLLFGLARDPTAGANVPIPLAIAAGVTWAVLAWAACSWVLSRLDIGE